MTLRSPVVVRSQGFKSSPNERLQRARFETQPTTLLVEGARQIDIPTRDTAPWRAALNDLKAIRHTPRGVCAIA